jgi:hypothetical protein
MARIRTVKPEYWSHPVMGRQDDATKCLGVALLNFSDDEGYFLADPNLVRSNCRPFDDDSAITRRCLSALVAAEWIEVSEHPTHGFIGRVVNFKEHQVIDRPKPSNIKPYFIADQSPINHLKCGGGKEGNREGKGKERNPPVEGSRGSSGKSKPEKPDPFGAYTPEVAAAANGIMELCPKNDLGGREIHPNGQKLALRLTEIMKAHPKVTAALAIQAWVDYMATKPQALKAPQYFFGKAEDQKSSDAANWYEYMKYIFHKITMAEKAAAAQPPAPMALVPLEQPEVTA